MVVVVVLVLVLEALGDEDVVILPKAM